MKVLVTGAAGFIGMYAAMHLMRRGDTVIGTDNLNTYYEPQLKRDRIARIEQRRQASNFRFEFLDLADAAGMARLFEVERFDSVVHLGAQAGVRYSLENPQAYAQSNLSGFLNVLEGCRHTGVAHLVYASSSSVYGGNTKMPFAETDPVDRPVSLYAATKKANELMAHSYSHLFGLPATGLRFFTVYGPWGRPDMAPMIFARAMLQGDPIRVFNRGNMRRDFTFVDDVVEGVVAVLERPPRPAQAPAEGPGSARSHAPSQIFNIGRSEPVDLMHFITLMEQAVGRKAILDLQPMQPGDVVATYADTSSLTEWTGALPRVSIEEGIPRFVAWYREYYRM